MQLEHAVLPEVSSLLRDCYAGLQPTSIEAVVAPASVDAGRRQLAVAGRHKAPFGLQDSLLKK